MKTTNAKKGFTLVELIMVIMIVAILAAVALPALQNYKTEAKDAATKHILGILRAGIYNQYVQGQDRCGQDGTTWPTAAQISGNDTTVGADWCSAAQVPNANERKFFASPVIPANPWNGLSTIGVWAGAAGSRPVPGNNCADAAAAGTNGWCYDLSNGDIWADSELSTGAALEDTF